MKILLVKTQRNIPSDFIESHESLALGYLCSSLRKDDFESNILDASILNISLEDTIKKVLNDKYDLVGFAIPDLTFIEPTISCIKEIKKENPQIHITLGGFTPTFHYKEILEISSDIDSVIMFEGENTIKELAEKINDKKEWRGIDGIAFKSKNEIIANKQRQLIPDLDSLSFPARDTLPILIKKYPDTFTVSVLTGRGCYKNCSFCSVRAFYSTSGGYSLRSRSNKNVIDEIENIVNLYSISEIIFVDDVFIGPGKKNKERIYQFAEELNNRGLKFIFTIAERVDNISYDVMSLLKDFGLRQIFLGLESGNQEILDHFDKDITLVQTEKAIEILSDLGIDTEVSFITFTPDCTLDQIEQNLDFFMRIGVNILQGLLNRLQCFGGTKVYEQLQRQGRLQGEFPFFSYSNKADVRVDYFYNIAKETLGGFLSISYEIKRIRRNIRKKMFEIEQNKDYLQLQKAVSLKSEFNNIIKTIMIEAGEAYKDLLEFSKDNYNSSKKEIERFKSKFSDDTTRLYQGWFNMIKFYENFRFNLELAKGSEEYEEQHANKYGII